MIHPTNPKFTTNLNVENKFKTTSNLSSKLLSNSINKMTSKLRSIMASDTVFTIVVLLAFAICLAVAIFIMLNLQYNA